jgi:tetratricopeptide (TPR) repeat protein
LITLNSWPRRVYLACHALRLSRRDQLRDERQHLRGRPAKWFPLQIHTLILAGSVMKPDFPWPVYLTETGYVQRVINECGKRDWILVLSQMFVPFLGMAGRIGFHGGDTDRFCNRYYEGGHSYYFLGNLMEERWLPLLAPADTDPIAESLYPPGFGTGAVRGIFETLLNNAAFFKIAAAAMIGVWVASYVYHERSVSQQNDQLQRFKHVALIANAAQIPDRDPSHVRDLLKMDLEDLPEDLQVDPESPPQNIKAIDPEKSDEGAKATWLERIFPDRRRRAYQAMRVHARAIRALAVLDGESEPDLKAARALFEEADQLYRPVADLARNSYALCLLDYGRVLVDLGEIDASAAVFKRVREGIYPKPEQVPAGWLGRNLRRLNPLGGAAPETVPRCPTSLLVDAYCAEASGYSGAQRWSEAREALDNAMNHAQPPAKPDEANPRLVSQVEQALAWLHMSQLKVRAAQRAFKSALSHLAEGSNADDFIGRNRAYNLRHGLAMATRLEGDPDKARALFGSLIAEIADDLARGDKYLPKQRRDPRARLGNSLERYADTRFFTMYRHGTEPARLSERAQQVIDDLQGAYWRSPPDSTDRPRMLYKMVIADFVAAPRERYVREEVRAALHQAEEVFSRLKPKERGSLKEVRSLALACDAFRRTFDSERVADSIRLVRYEGNQARPRDATQEGVMIRQQAFEDIRGRIKEAIPNGRDLGRDQVEVLLLGAEILLDNRVVEPVGQDRASRSIAPGTTPKDPSGGRPADAGDQRATDAALLIELLGVTMRSAEHPELGKYLGHYHRLAAGAYQTSPTGEPPTPDVYSKSLKPTPATVSDESVVLYWRFGKDLSLTIRHEPRSVLLPGEKMAGP